MRKYASLMLATIVLAGCAQPAQNIPVTEQGLQHHRFELQSVDGKPLVLEKTKHMPELSFSENMHISGAMCNRFTGQAVLEGDTLKAKGLVMTRMLCFERKLNELDHMISDMLNAGAQVSMTSQQLELKTSQHTLTYKLADLVN